MSTTTASLEGEEVLKIILAVACIVLLAYLAVNLYGIFQQKTRLEQAKAHMDEIERVMNSLGNGESARYTLLSPAGYSLTGWNKTLVAKDGRTYFPATCAAAGWQVCLCLCYYGETVGQQLGSLFGDTAGFVRRCETQGACRQVKGDIIVTPNALTGKTRLYPIHIASLIKDKNALNISLSNGVYEVHPTA